MRGGDDVRQVVKLLIWVLIVVEEYGQPGMVEISKTAGVYALYVSYSLLLSCSYIASSNWLPI